MFDPFNEPALQFVGFVSQKDVNGGGEVPVFEPVPPKDKPSINTLEGWNAAAARINRRSFIAEFGRAPTCDEEVQNWVRSVCKG